MKWKLAAAVATLSLGACGSEPAPAPTQSASTAMPDLPVVGEEVSILALGDSLRIVDGTEFPEFFSAEGRGS